MVKEVVRPDISGLLSRLKSRPQVNEATIFGQAIRALVNQDDPLSDIAAPGIDIRPAQPNLEDVFVTLAKNQKNAA